MCKTSFSVHATENRSLNRPRLSHWVLSTFFFFHSIVVCQKKCSLGEQESETNSFSQETNKQRKEKVRKKKERKRAGERLWKGYEYFIVTCAEWNIASESLKHFQIKCFNISKWHYFLKTKLQSKKKKRLERLNNPKMKTKDIIFNETKCFRLTLNKIFIFLILRLPPFQNMKIFSWFWLNLNSTWLFLFFQVITKLKKPLII